MDNLREDTADVLIMADDGSGWSINIPSYIIRLEDGEKLIGALTNGTQVTIKASLDIVHPDNRVEYDIWYASILDLEYW